MNNYINENIYNDKLVEQIINYENHDLIAINNLLNYENTNITNNLTDSSLQDQLVNNIICDNINCDNICDSAWDDAINDNKFILNNKIIRIFPQLKNVNNYSKLKIDDDSLSYITIREIADLTSKIICHHLIKYNINPQKVTIVDYTSGVGGNVLSFCKYFNKIYAIELSKIRYENLINNIDVYGFKNTYCINDSSINFTYNELEKIHADVVFIDPPWGGSEYKSSDSLRLMLGEKPIEELTIDIFNIFLKNYKKLKETTNEKNNTKFVILKLPKNYDIEHLYYYIQEHNNIENHIICIYLYILNKMLIVVFEFFNIIS